ncbi:type II toxin-antitoxin system VapB family antitoxin [Sphingomonas sp. dw_22]|uniref:type II toxin-antitoxin system VapB family antitoxin n=1 Tax=Sphingomonas sp. dw_22 TaxID=2721175 RepID=UPI001BD2DC66|nr:type II toxin-antitoxin system VapB family antitoxin [Sphingomonas sp. dw_22]
MGALYIKDEDTAALVRRVAERSGLTNTALIRELAAAREAELNRGERRLSAREKLERFWREHPLPPPTGLKADKAFFDELSGDL